mmetsp:Transcript_3791/g.4892  ORF Transcript_3791/g.4892 Transcript_3791/m.4892 type:complete len:107 (-) Transcript_3791:290-610(-)
MDCTWNSDNSTPPAGHNYQSTSIAIACHFTNKKSNETPNSRRRRSSPYHATHKISHSSSHLISNEKNQNTTSTITTDTTTSSPTPNKQQQPTLLRFLLEQSHTVDF